MGLINPLDVPKLMFCKELLDEIGTDGVPVHMKVNIVGKTQISSPMSSGAKVALPAVYLSVIVSEDLFKQFPESILRQIGMKS